MPVHFPGAHEHTPGGRPSLRRRWRRAASATLLLALTGSAGYVYVNHSPLRRHTAAARVDAAPGGVVPAAPRRIADHVIVVSVDGLRPDAIARYAPETITRLARAGATSLTAQTILPSLTLPSHTSMLTGAGPGAHGITWNTDLTGTRGRHLAVPTIFTLVRQSGLTTAAFFSKSKFHHLETLPSLDYSQSPSGGWGKVLADRTGDDVERYLRQSRPNLLFVHLGDPDYAGHALGWMTPAYGAAVRSADDALEDIVEAADASLGVGRYVLILTADHGGHGRLHGSSDPRDTTIPWIAAGAGVRGGVALPDGIRTMDTAATVLWLLGIAPPPHVEGRPVLAAFTSG